MSAIYDSWEKLVAAVLKKEQLWQLCHAPSTSTSISSASSDFSFCRLNSSLDDVPCCFSSPEWSVSNQKDDDFGSEIAAATSSSILFKDQSSIENLLSIKNASFTPPRKRDLMIEVPKLRIQDRGFSRVPQSSEYCSSVSTRMANPHIGSRVNRDDGIQQSYPLPLPPDAMSSSSHISRPNSAAKSPSAPLLSPERAEKVKSPGSPERAEKVKSPVTSWKKGKLIGRGPLGNVYVGFDSEKGEMCVMEEIFLSPDDAESKQSARMLEKEIALLSSIKHPHIVQYYGSELVVDNFYIYFEYVAGGTIYKILQEYGRLGESVIRIYTQQILSVLVYLHSKGIVHRDIKGANILVDPNGRVKLTSFGIEMHIAEELRTSWFINSPYWMAPEIITNQNMRNSANDIWSLGCTVLEMATSKPPLSQYDRGLAMFKIANRKELPTFPDHLSDVCKDFLKHCLQWNPRHRATASQLLEHPFVKNSLPLGKQILVSTSSVHPAVTNAVKSEGMDHARISQQSDSGKASKSNSEPSNIYTPRHISAPVSPVGSPFLHPRSPQHLSRRMSPPPKSSRHMSSTTIIGGISVIPHPHINQSMLRQETSHNLPKHSPNIKSPSYWDPNILRGVFRFS